MARFIISDFDKANVYAPGDIFGVFEVKNIREARAMKMNIQDVYGVKVDFQIYGK